MLQYTGKRLHVLKIFSPLILSLSLLEITIFTPDLVRFVLENPRTGNLLFHGDMPSDSKGEFDEKSLKSALKKAYPGKFPKKFDLAVVSLLTRETKEEEDFMAQIYSYFTKEKDVDINSIKMQTEYEGKSGIWYWWQVRPFVKHRPAFSEDVSWNDLELAYQNLTASDVQTELLDQTFDGTTLNFVKCIETLEELLNRANSKPLVIYVHSRRGFNRNGAVLAAYLMKYESEDIESAWNAILEEPNLIYEQQEMKSFLYYYQAYLELF